MLRLPVTLVWLLLMAVTLLSWVLGSSDGDAATSSVDPAAS